MSYNAPSLSVVVPTHGRLDLFQKTLESLVDQDTDDFELIITDDSPEESTREAIQKLTQEYGEKTKRLVQYLFTQPKLGQARNTNQGLAQAKGRYLRILHSDDILAPNALRNEIQFLNREDTFSNSPHILFHDVIAFQDVPRFGKTPQVSFVSPKEYATHCLHSQTPLPSALVFSREAFEAAGPLREDLQFLCDWEFFYRLLKFAHEKFQFITHVSPGFVAWRTHQNSTTGRLWHAHFLEHESFVEDILKENSELRSPVIPEYTHNVFRLTAARYRYLRLINDALQFSSKSPLASLYKFLRCGLSRRSFPLLFQSKHASSAPSSKFLRSYEAILVKLVSLVAAPYLNKHVNDVAVVQTTEAPRDIALGTDITIAPHPSVPAALSNTTAIYPPYDNAISLYHLRPLIQSAESLSVTGVNSNRFFEKTTHEILKYTSSKTVTSFTVQDNQHLSAFGLKALIEKLFPNQFAWSSQQKLSPQKTMLQFQRKSSSPDYFIQQHTGWTFGMLTLGSKPEAVDAFIDSVEKHCTSPYEIILVAPKELPQGSRKNTTVITFSQNDDLGWITRKKNLICEMAQYSDILICHDRYVLTEDFFSQFQSAGYAYALAAPRVVSPENKRLHDWSVVSSNNNTWSHGGLLHYYDYSEYAYIPGGATILRKAFWQDFPWNENLFWNEHEDVELCRRAQRHGVVLSLAPATLIASQDRWVDQNPLIPLNPQTRTLYGAPVSEQVIKFLS